MQVMHGIDTRRLKICMLTDCYPPGIGGIETHVYSLAGQLGQLGHRVDVVTHQAVAAAPERVPTDSEPSEPLLNVTVHRLPGFVAHVKGADPVIDPRIIGRLRQYLAANTYDIVHGHSFGSLLALTGLRAVRKRQTPCVITKHSVVLVPSRPSFINHMILRMEHWAAQKWTDGVITVSKGVARELAAGRFPVYTIPGGVDCTHWRSDPVTREQTRRQLGYHENHVVIGYLSRLVASKGILGLPGTAAHLAKSLPDIRFLVVGDGPLRQQLEREIDRLGLRGLVTLAGFKPWRETPDYLNAMDIFAFPSRVEALGLALMEAMACGIAAVAYSNDGSREIITNGRTGCLVTSDEELFQRLFALARYPALRYTLGANGCAKIREVYNWRSVAERTVEVYRGIAKMRLEGIPEFGGARHGLIPVDGAAGKV